MSTVSGNVQTLTSAAPASVVVRFSLQNCRVAPRIVGTSFIATTVADFVPDASGNITGSIWRNDEITCVSLNDSFYTVSVVQLQGGAQQTAKTLNVKIVTPTFDLNSAQSFTTLSPTPFVASNIIANPPASQTISQPQGTQLITVGRGVFQRFQGTVDEAHGVELVNESNPLRKWQFTQRASNDLNHPAYSFLLSSDDGTNQFNYLRCELNAGTCRWLAATVDAGPSTTTDMTGGFETMPVKFVASGTSVPAACTAKKAFIVDDNEAVFANKFKQCNAAGTGWTSIASAVTAGVADFNTRAGSVTLLAADVTALSGVVPNGWTIDSANNILTTRSKYWWDAAGCNASTPSNAMNTPAANGATAACKNGSTNADISYGVMDFVDGSATTATAVVRLPSDYASSTSIDATLVWIQDGSVGDPAQNVIWLVAVTCPAITTESLDKAWNTSQSKTSATLAQNLQREVTATSLSATGCSANNKLILRIARDGANGSDTFTGTARLIGVELTLVRNQ